MANYFWYALSAIAGAIISGILVDKYTAHSIAVVTQLPMLFATLLLGLEIILSPSSFSLFFWHWIRYVAANDQLVISRKIRDKMDW